MRKEVSLAGKPVLMSAKVKTSFAAQAIKSKMNQTQTLFHII